MKTRSSRKSYSCRSKLRWLRQCDQRQRTARAHHIKPERTGQEIINMSIERNKKQMGRFVTFINTADPALAEELVDPSAKFHVPFKVQK